MKRSQLFLTLYGHFEVALNLVSGGLMLFAARFFLKLYAPSFEDGPLFDSPLTLMLVRSFGYMIVTLGLVQYAAIRWGNQQVRQWFLVGLLLGDCFHIGVSWVFFWPVGFNAGALFSLVISVLLAASRSYFLLTGVPDLSTNQRKSAIKAKQEKESLPRQKNVSGNTIGELSTAVGYDVRDLKMEGYSWEEINEVASGRMTLEELRQRGPGKQ